MSEVISGRAPHAASAQIGIFAIRAFETLGSIHRLRLVVQPDETHPGHRCRRPASPFPLPIPGGRKHVLEWQPDRANLLTGDGCTLCLFLSILKHPIAVVPGDHSGWKCPLPRLTVVV